MTCPICGQKPMNCNCTPRETHQFEENEYLSDQVTALNDQVEDLTAEVARLKRGEFTEEEFQYLCHNFSEDDACRFRQGCEAYQRKLFGEKRT